MGPNGRKALLVRVTFPGSVHRSVSWRALSRSSLTRILGSIGDQVRGLVRSSRRPGGRVTGTRPLRPLPLHIRSACRLSFFLLVSTGLRRRSASRLRLLAGPPYCTGSRRTSSRGCCSATYSCTTISTAPRGSLPQCESTAQRRQRCPRPRHPHADRSPTHGRLVARLERVRGQARGWYSLEWCGAASRAIDGRGALGAAPMVAAAAGTSARVSPSRRSSS